MNKSLPLCVGTVGVSKQGRIVPLRCKRWNCTTCARINALILSIRVVEGIKYFNELKAPLTFITLTHWGRVTPRQGYEQLPEFWGKLAKKLNRASLRREGLKIEYAAFVEEQTRGVPHLHAVATLAITTRELKELAVSCGFGYQAHADAVRSPAVGWYVAKYLTKSDGTMPNAPKGHRRVRFSREWPELPKPQGGSDLIVKAPNETLMNWALRAQAAGVRKPVEEILEGVHRILVARDLELTLAELESGVDIPTEQLYH